MSGSSQSTTSPKRTRIWHDRRGAVAILFALAALPLTGLVGLAIDYAMYLQSVAALNAAGDTAALNAAKTAAAAFQAHDPKYVAEGVAAGQQWFAKEIGAGARLNDPSPTPTIAITSNKTTVTVSLTYSSSVPSLLGKLFGVGNYKLNVASGSAITVPTYVAIQILIDTSASMGILVDTVNDPANLLADVKLALPAQSPSGGNVLLGAATKDGIVTTSNYVVTPTAAPNGQCAFACHFDNGTSGPSGYSNDYYGVAEAKSLRLRIDVLRAAVQTIISLVMNSVQAPYVQFGLYGFSTGLQTISALSGNLSTVYTDANAINVTPLHAYCNNGNYLPPVCNDPNGVKNGYGSGFNEDNVPVTNLAASVNTLISSTLTPAPTQDGLSAATAIRYVFVITDGLDDYVTSGGTRVISAMSDTDGAGNATTSPTICDTLKNTGATVMILDTTYNSIPTNWFYEDYVASWVEPTASSTVVSKLQACASPGGNYFQADSPSEIQAAMTQMLAQAAPTAARLIQ